MKWGNCQRNSTPKRTRPRYSVSVRLPPIRSAAALRLEWRDRRCQSGALLQRRVDREVHRAREQTEQARFNPGSQREINHADGNQCRSKGTGFGGGQLSARERTRRGAAHPRIGHPLDEMIQRRGAGSHQRRAKKPCAPCAASRAARASRDSSPPAWSSPQETKRPAW